MCTHSEGSGVPHADESESTAETDLAPIELTAAKLQIPYPEPLVLGAEWSRREMAKRSLASSIERIAARYRRDGPIDIETAEWSAAFEVLEAAFVSGDLDRMSRAPHRWEVRADELFFAVYFAERYGDPLKNANAPLPQTAEAQMPSRNCADGSRVISWGNYLE